ncbi:hypothetical protein D7024_09115 [Desulfofundulus salinus]|uniref:HD domain-containing protein n=1 Tax=Desulfofundulus salinus TaxID=2419843 RepID=A0A494WUQ1_9FIRM|nr:hypothetical protein D7024_09115 [Desulfofundulus salinum]
MLVDDRLVLPHAVEEVSNYFEGTCLAQAAFSHDCGKISWPSCLVDKRVLDEENCRLVHAHPIAGAHYLREYCKVQRAVILANKGSSFAQNNANPRGAKITPLFHYSRCY